MMHGPPALARWPRPGACAVRPSAEAHAMSGAEILKIPGVGIGSRPMAGWQARRRIVPCGPAKTSRRERASSDLMGANNQTATISCRASSKQWEAYTGAKIKLDRDLAQCRLQHAQQAIAPPARVDFDISGDGRAVRGTTAGRSLLDEIPTVRRPDRSDDLVGYLQPPIAPRTCKPYRVNNPTATAIKPRPIARCNFGPGGIAGENVRPPARRQTAASKALSGRPTRLTRLAAHGYSDPSQGMADFRLYFIANPATRQFQASRQAPAWLFEPNNDEADGQQSRWCSDPGRDGSVDTTGPIRPTRINADPGHHRLQQFPCRHRPRNADVVGRVGSSARPRTLSLVGNAQHRNANPASERRYNADDRRYWSKKAQRSPADA